MSFSIGLDLNIPSNWTTFLTILYRPLIGEQACTLYTLLYGLAKENLKVEMSDIEALMLTNVGLVKQARERLEEFDLLKSYGTNEEEIAWLELKGPLTADAFMKHPIYRRLLSQKIGSEGIERIKRLLEPKKKRLKDLSKTLCLDQYESNEESNLSFTWPEPEQYDFDWEVFFQNMHRTIPERLRISKNMNQIAYLANLYGLSEKDIRPIVVRHLSEDKTSIDFEGIIEDLKNSTKIQDSNPDDFSQAPIRFLKANQPKQAKVLPKEKEILTNLSQVWHFSNELINTLVDYSMKQCQGQFIGRYILTVANNMARMNIHTRKEALAYFEKSQQIKSPSKKFSSKSQLGPEEVVVPDWYDTASQELASEEEIEELMRLGQQILQNQQEDSSTPSFLQEDSAQNWSVYQDLEKNEGLLASDSLH